MRSNFPPGGKRVSDWVGMTVESRVALRNGHGSMPKGTRYRVTYARSGLSMHSIPCRCCGASQFIRSVDPRDVQPVAASVPECAHERATGDEMNGRCPDCGVTWQTLQAADDEDLRDTLGVQEKRND